MVKKAAVDGNRRRFLGGMGALGAMASLPRMAGGQGGGGYPARSITLYCPWSTGSNTDLLLRQLTEAASLPLQRKARPARPA